MAITSGAIVTLSATVSNSTNTVSLGAGTGWRAFYLPGEKSFLFQNTQGSGNTNFNGPITGPGSLAISGSNNVYLNNTSNSFNGGATLNAGTEPIPNGPAKVWHRDGQLPRACSVQPNSNPIVIPNPTNLNGYLTFNSNPVCFTGVITLTSNTVINPTNVVSISMAPSARAAVVPLGW